MCRYVQLGLAFVFSLRPLENPGSVFASDLVRDGA